MTLTESIKLRAKFLKCFDCDRNELDQHSLGWLGSALQLDLQGKLLNQNPRQALGDKNMTERWEFRPSLTQQTFL